MFISGFHIDGFGLYHDQGLKDITPGLVLVLGENECGKSTLMEFIRTVLFGFRRKSKNINDFQILPGGSHGGRLQVVMQDGRRLTIERLGRKAIIAEGGGALEAEPSQRLLGGLDRETFNKIFAIGLDDLRGLEVLSRERVSGRLFSAGAGLGAASVPAAAQALDKELGSLLTPGGRTQLVHQKLKQLKEIEGRIKDLRELSANYAEAQAQKEHIEELIGRIKGEKEDIAPRLRRLEQLEQALNPYLDFRRAREKAGELEYAGGFPVNGLERLEALAKDIQDRRQRLNVREEEGARLEQQGRGLTVDPAILGNREPIEALLGEREKLATARADYPARQNRLHQAESEFRRRLGELGAQWDESRLAQVDTSVETRQQVQEFGRRLSAAERSQEAAQAYQRTATEALNAANQEADAAEARWRDFPIPPETDEPQLGKKREALRQLRALIHRRDVAAAFLKARVAAREEDSRRLAALQKERAAYRAPLPSWLWLPAGLSGLILAGILAFYRKSYYPAGLAAALGAGLGALFYFLYRRQRQADARRFKEQEQEIEAGLAALAGELGDLEEGLKALETDLEPLTRAAGLETGDLGALEQMDQELEQSAQQLREMKVLERERHKAETQRHGAAQRLDQAREETEKALKELEAVQGRWQEWLTARGFSPQIRPEGFEAVLNAVENARGAGRNLEEERRRLAEIESYLTGAQARLLEVLAACGRAPGAGEPGVEDLDALRRALSAALTTQAQQKDLEGKLAAARGEAANLAQEQEAREGEQARLLRNAGAGDEEEFRRLARAHEQWREARAEGEKNEFTLRQMAGSPEALTALEAELQATDRLKLQWEKDSLAERLQKLNEAYSQHDQEIGRLRQRLMDLAQNEELGALLLEERRLKEQLADATRRWATLAVCRRLLDQARGVYEQERQPQVIKEAGAFLNTMVGGRYRLVSSLGEDAIQLEDLDLKRKEEITWSAGLADQVYLAIRLGLARQFSRHLEPLPVILDDVLVKFDPARRLKAARVLLEFSRGQQVLMFSCHPELREIMEEVRQEPDLKDAAITYFTIADGVIGDAAPALKGIDGR